MRLHFLTVIIASASLTSIAAANEFQQELETLARTRITELAKTSEVVAAVIEQNRRTGSYTQADIQRLDAEWAEQARSINQPMIDEVMDNALSRLLVNKQETSGGLFTEIIVMDAKGLNVGQSELTSDFWQGDESKWRETMLKGPGSLDISDISQDESTQSIQSQVSLPVIDPATGEAIGALTVGVNIEQL
ncbi:hypothetical protein V6L76_13845 [Pannonibacter sp. Pt2]|uniref:Uncharacterized protein n=1 Tax=Pannonibacter anstelovis TaxID=3121537 RepID=A0ABU7ZQ34_9HYPH